MECCGQTPSSGRNTVVLVRHAESTFNRNGESGFDAPITAGGRHQAKELQGHYDYALVSAMCRARQTWDASRMTATRVEFSTLPRERQSTTPCNTIDGERGLIESGEDFAFRVQQLRDYVKHLCRKHPRVLVLAHHKVMHALTGTEVANCASIAYDLQ